MKIIAGSAMEKIDEVLEENRRLKETLAGIALMIEFNGSVTEKEKEKLKLIVGDTDNERIN